MIDVNQVTHFYSVPKSTTFFLYTLCIFILVLSLCGIFLEIRVLFHIHQNKNAMMKTCGTLAGCLLLLIVAIFGFLKTNKDGKVLINLTENEIKYVGPDEVQIIKRSNISYITRMTDYYGSVIYVITPKNDQEQQITVPRGLKTDDYFKNWMKSWPA